MRYLNVNNLQGIDKKFFELIESDMKDMSMENKNNRIENLITFLDENKDFNIDFIYTVSNKKLDITHKKGFRAINPVGFIVELLKLVSWDKANELLLKMKDRCNGELFSDNTLLKLSSKEINHEESLDIPEYTLELEISKSGLITKMIDLCLPQESNDFKNVNAEDTIDKVLKIMEMYTPLLKANSVLFGKDKLELLKKNVFLKILKLEEHDFENMKVIDTLFPEDKEKMYLKLYSKLHHSNFQRQIKEDFQLNIKKWLTHIEKQSYFDYGKVPPFLSDYGCFINDLYEEDNFLHVKNLKENPKIYKTLKNDFDSLIEKKIEKYIDKRTDIYLRNKIYKEIELYMFNEDSYEYEKNKAHTLKEWFISTQREPYENFEHKRYEKIKTLINAREILFEQSMLKKIINDNIPEMIKNKKRL